ncbi:MAG: CBS domain-containing protein [Zhongshania sp.]|uniref:CBS domain-containing protein n=1 Tax=Zhongshania guokunii TaxID=641783 RepID=A0ABV3U399_9GAMM|nr:CBS domain-containing protein [Zhongshania sp.]MDF1691490.1 CBS domain-containing protein [Zhongshania sp.]
MKQFGLYDADRVDQLAHPENFDQLNGDSPAMVVFTDFKVHEPMVIDATTSALEAENMMKRSHVRLKLVVDEYGSFLGVVALEDLSDSEMIKKVADGYNREELQVNDMMRKRQDLKVFDFRELELMTVSDVLDVLRQYGHQHCLVVERSHHQIRGVISASDIARKLKMDVSIQRPPKFAELYLSSLHR